MDECECKRLIISKDSSERFMRVLICDKCGKRWTHSKTFGWVEVKDAEDSRDE